MPSLDVGDLAPDFDLPVLTAGVKGRFSLRESPAKLLVFAFYPSNWEPISTEQLIGYQVERDNFLARNAEVVGINVDSIMNSTVWEREIGPLEFPLCSDFWPHAAVCLSYGVLREEEPFRGTCERAVFVLDRSRRIAFRKIYSLDKVPPVAEVFSALDQL